MANAQGFGDVLQVQLVLYMGSDNDNLENDLNAFAAQHPAYELVTIVAPVLDSMYHRAIWRKKYPDQP